MRTRGRDADSDATRNARTATPLEVAGLTVTLGGGCLFRQFDLVLQRGESVALIGPSGAGKTTLLNCILGTVHPVAGRITVAGLDVTGASRSKLARIRAEHLGIVFQHGELLGELGPVENVALPALINGCPSDEAIARATELLRSLGVPTNRGAADDLSGGERQRTALARALVNRPSLVLADEPTGSLDPTTRDRVADLLFAVPKQWGCALLVVTHDPEVASRSNRVVDLTTPGQAECAS